MLPRRGEGCAGADHSVTRFGTAPRDRALGQRIADCNNYTQLVFTELLRLLERARPDTKQVCRDRDFEHTTAMLPQSKRDARRAVVT
jgi:hypothetical protein